MMLTKISPYFQEINFPFMFKHKLDPLYLHVIPIYPLNIKICSLFVTHRVLSQSICPLVNYLFIYCEVVIFQ